MEFDRLTLGLGFTAIASAGVAIAARSALPRRRVLLYVFKPLTTVLIIMVALLGGAQPWSAYRAAVLVGLLFSLVGDIWLMLPKDRFVAGLFSFLLALLTYCYAFARTITGVGIPWVAAPFVLVGSCTLWYLWPGLRAALRGPVVTYVLVMVAMASLGSYRATTNPSSGALAAAVGGALFLVSDALLAIDRFRHPILGISVLNLGTYYVGQLLIALSTVMASQPTG